MSSTVQEEYDRVFYPGSTFTQTHPDRLATLATLFGMRPAPLDRCRVLELGCTDGGNLIPMAYTLPTAEFVGVDISARAISTGLECIEALGLRNIRLLELDILEVSDAFGLFDYIIAHGVYSWVPPAVREKVLSLCRAHLSPNGVAYISYNTHPGGHIRDLVRGMMRFHVQAINDPAQKRRAAIALLQFVATSQPQPNVFRQVVESELAWLEKSSDAAFHHDDLASVRASFYFHEFIADAGRHNLQYLSEAMLHQMQAEVFSHDVAARLDRMSSDRLAREQYLDFLKCRRFRQTLLCHSECAVDGPRAERIADLFIASRARAGSASPSLEQGVAEEFTAPGDATIKTGDRRIKAMLLHLEEIWPQSCRFTELLEAGGKRLGGDEKAFSNAEARTELAGAFLSMYSAGLIELHPRQPAFVLEPGEKPMASAIARWAIANEASVVPNLRHCGIRLDDPIAVRLVSLLDGSRDRAALVHELAKFCRSRQLICRPDGTPVNDLGALRAIIDSGFADNLRKLGRMALLVG